MSPIQLTRVPSFGYPGPKPKLIFRSTVVPASATPSIAEAEAGSPHSFTSPTEPAFPTTPTKRTPLKDSSFATNTSPFKGFTHSPSRAAHLLDRNSKRGDLREGLFSRFERNDPGLEYLNKTNALTQAKTYITTEDYKGNERREEIKSPTRLFFSAVNTPATEIVNPFSTLLQQRREEIDVTPNPNPKTGPYAAILRDPKDHEAYERKKAAAKKYSDLLEISLKASKTSYTQTSTSHSQYSEEKVHAEAMTDPAHFHHALLRPCIIQILRAAGYHASKPSVVDVLTDLAAKYLMTMATRTVNYAALMRNTTQVDVQDVRMAMSDLGALMPTMMIEDEILLPEGEDIRGVESFLEWAMGKENKEIRRVALEGGGEGGGGVDFLTSLMRKHDNVEGADGTSRWDGTVLGKMLPPHEVVIEGDEITSIKEWNKAQARKRWANTNGKANDDGTNDKDKTTNSTRQSSELSDLAEGDVEDAEMEGVEVSQSASIHKTE